MTPGGDTGGEPDSRKPFPVLEKVGCQFGGADYHQGEEEKAETCLGEEIVEEGFTVQDKENRKEIQQQNNQAE